MADPPHLGDQQERSEAVSLRLSRLRDRLAAAGADPDAVTIVAVTKGFGAWAIEAAAAAGLREVGENYAQELLAKLAELPQPVAEQLSVHFIGHLQTNKVRQLAGHIDVYQSVDRPSLVRELAKRCPGADVMLQLNLSGATTQGGCAPTDAPALLRRARDAGLNVVGAMAIGHAEDSVRTGRLFDQLRRFADDYGLEHRSMGMSGDLEAAVRAGTTMVRVGTALFGERRTRAVGG